jgi:hypothetical protein
MLAKLALIDPELEADGMLTADMGTSEQLLVSVAVDYRSLAAV